MFYRLKVLDEEKFIYNIDDTESTKEYILEILHFSPLKKIINNNKYRKSLSGEKNLQKCIEFLCHNYSISINDVERGRNIYCPFHENANTSKSASGKFNIKSGYFTCFSSNCVIPINSKTGFRQLSATQLLKKLQKEKNDLAISES